MRWTWCWFRWVQGPWQQGLDTQLKCRRSEVKIICVQPRNAPAMTLSYRVGRIVEVGAPNTIADGVAGRYVVPEVLNDLLAVADDGLLVGEESIKEGMNPLVDHAGLVVEPATALGVAAILEGSRSLRHKISRDRTLR
jgi:threonine dehydratase